MITGDRVLRTVSVSIFLAMTIFSIFVVVRETRKPDTPFERIKQKECGSIFILNGESSDSVSTEDDLLKRKESCFFIDRSLKKSGPLFRRVFRHGYLKSMEYLYIGENGVLLRKGKRDFERETGKLFSCFVKGECPEGDEEKDKFTFTLSMVNSLGTHVVSATLEDISLPRAMKRGKRLLDTMLDVKGLKKEGLKLNLMFHRPYALFEGRNRKKINELTKSYRDGLYMKARGAKIRLLPFEYRRDPHKRITYKGRQYGLAKDDHKKEHTSFYIFRTEQFIQKGDRMVRLEGRRESAKSIPTSGEMIKLFSDFILRSQEKTGEFREAFDIYEGKLLKRKSNLTTQLLVLDVLTDLYKRSKDEKVLASVKSSIDHLSSKVESMSLEEKFFFYSSILSYEAIVKKGEYVQLVFPLEKLLMESVGEEELSFSSKPVAPLGLLALFSQYEVTGDSRYKQLAMKTLRELFADVNKKRERVELTGYTAYVLPFVDKSFSEEFVNILENEGNINSYDDNSFPEYVGALLQRRSPDKNFNAVCASLCLFRK